MKHCQWCDTAFETAISYQIYCSPECRTFATREKIAERYSISKRNDRLNKKRICKSCGARLSIYNDSNTCLACDVNPNDVKKALRDMRGIANGKPDPEE